MAYRRSSGPFEQVQSFLLRSGAPFTTIVIALSVLIFLAEFLSVNVLVLLASLLECVVGPGAHPKVWTVFLYPLQAGSVLTLIFSSMWLWSIGGYLERMWGTRAFGLFMLVVTALTPLCTSLGMLILRSEGTFGFSGLWLPLAAMTVAWAAIDPYAETTFNFVFKTQARWVAWITIVLIYFGQFFGRPLLGLFALIPCGLAWLYVRKSLPYSVRSLFDGQSRNSSPSGRKPGLRIMDIDRKPPQKSGLETLRRSKRGPLGAYRDWQERRRLEKLWRNSGFSDRDERSGRG